MRQPDPPERSHHTPGVELSTGPLGQGFGNGVGMAIAEAWLAARYNRPGHTIVDHYTFALVSDGDLMEGVAAEAASLAGPLRLGKLVYLYDQNHVSLAGGTALIFTEDGARRFDANGWHTATVADGNDVDAIAAAPAGAKAAADRPSLVLVRSTIGLGSPKKHGTFGAHGTPLGDDELKATKRALGWPTEDRFFLPDEAVRHFRQAVPRGEAAQRDWQARLDAYAAACPAEAADWRRVTSGTLATGGRTTCRGGRARTSRWPPGSRLGRRSTPSPAGCRTSSAGRPTSTPRPTPP